MTKRKSKSASEKADADELRRLLSQGNGRPQPSLPRVKWLEREMPDG